MPSDRRDEGLIMTRSARESMALAALNTPEFSRGIFLRRQEEIQRLRYIAEKLNLQPANIERVVEHFSGGNQQKF